jgi:hypothetical protein
MDGKRLLFLKIIFIFVQNTKFSSTMLATPSFNTSTFTHHHIINIHPILLLLNDNKRSSLALSIASTPIRRWQKLTDFLFPNIRTFLCLRARLSPLLSYNVQQ